MIQRLCCPALAWPTSSLELVAHDAVSSLRQLPLQRHNYCMQSRTTTAPHFWPTAVPQDTQLGPIPARDTRGGGEKLPSRAPRVTFEHAQCAVRSVAGGALLSFISSPPLPSPHRPPAPRPLTALVALSGARACVCEPTSARACRREGSFLSRAGAPSMSFRSWDVEQYRALLAVFPSVQCMTYREG